MSSYDPFFFFQFLWHVYCQCLPCYSRDHKSCFDDDLFQVRRARNEANPERLWSRTKLWLKGEDKIKRRQRLRTNLRAAQESTMLEIGGTNMVLWCSSKSLPNSPRCILHLSSSWIRCLHFTEWMFLDCINHQSSLLWTRKSKGFMPNDLSGTSVPKLCVTNLLSFQLVFPN